MSDTAREPLETCLVGTAAVSVFGRPHDYRFRDFVPDQFSALAQLTEATPVYVPRVTSFNTRIVAPRDFPLSLYDGNIHTGIDADGVLLAPGDTAVIVTGDCPTIVLCDRSSGYVVATHAGRDSLIDRARVASGRSSRPHESVLDAVFAYTTWNPAEVTLRVIAGIAPEYFAHPVSHPSHGDANRRLILDMRARYGDRVISGLLDSGCIDLYALIRAQAEAYGVPTEQVSYDALDTYTDARLWSNRNAEKAGKRNAVRVTNAARAFSDSGR